MPLRQSEALILRNYPLREADLIVSFFCRDQGKLRGVARGVRRPKNRFGVGLERLAHSRVFYRQKENASLVTLQRAELVGPANLWKASYPASVMLDVIAETADRVLPANEPQDSFFRLLQIVTEQFKDGIASKDSAAAVPRWAHRALLYFLLWSARLGGWLPPLDRCMESNSALEVEETAYFSPHREGLFRAEFKDTDSWMMSPESRAIARLMLERSPDQLRGCPWSEAAALTLQRFLLQRTHDQLEKRLQTSIALLALWRDVEPIPAGRRR